MKYILVFLLGGLFVLSPAHAQDAGQNDTNVIILDKPVRSASPPVVANPRKVALEAKQKAAREKAATRPLPPPAIEIPPVPQPKAAPQQPTSRRRDAITGQVIEEGAPVAKARQSNNERIREKYKKRRMRE